MKTKSKLIVAPIKTSDMEQPNYMACYVTTFIDEMKEPNLESVICQITKKDLLPKMDSVSKQRVLHNLFANVCV